MLPELGRVLPLQRSAISNPEGHTMPLLATPARVIHVRLDGRSYDLPLDRLGITEQARDEQVRAAVARHLEVAARQLSESVVDRHPNGNLTIRPEAVFG
jgi:hypothetical protein